MHILISLGQNIHSWLGNLLAECRLCPRLILIRMCKKCSMGDIELCCAMTPRCLLFTCCLWILSGYRINYDKLSHRIKLIHRIDSVARSIASIYWRLRLINAIRLFRCPHKEKRNTAFKITQFTDKCTRVMAPYRNIYTYTKIEIFYTSAYYMNTEETEYSVKRNGVHGSNAFV